MKTDNQPNEPTELYRLTIFRCSDCSGRAIPINGFGEPCPHCGHGTLDAKTSSQQTQELTAEQAANFADCVITEI